MYAGFLAWVYVSLMTVYTDWLTPSGNKLLISRLVRAIRLSFLWETAYVGTLLRILCARFG